MSPIMCRPAPMVMAVDTEGRMYVTTTLGVQVLDQLGRVNLILSKPEGWLAVECDFSAGQTVMCCT